MFKLLPSKSNSYAKIDQLRYLSQSALIEETKPPYAVRTTLFLVSSIILILIVWAGFTKIDEIAITTGEVIPSKYVQSIQHLEGGIVSEIKVIEGELVQKGQIIITLDGTAAKQDLSALQARKLSLQYKALRLRSFINNTSPDFNEIEHGNANQNLIKEQLKSFDSMVEAKEDAGKVILEQITQKEEALNGLNNQKNTLQDNIKIEEEELALKTKLNKKGHLSRFKLLQAQKQFNEIKGELHEAESETIQAQNAILEYKSRLESLESNLVDDSYRELSTVKDNIVQIEENIKKIDEQVHRLEIKSPSYGYIKALNIKTIGGVIKPGQVLVKIVPLEGKLVLETKISPKDIGYIKTGQTVKVKISSYDFSRHGTIDGILDHISATTFIDIDGSRYYMGRVSIAQNYVGSDPKKNIIVPGMTVQADIVTGNKSILAYLLKPIHRSVTTAFTER